MVRLTLRQGTGSMSMQRRLMRLLGATLLVLSIGSAVGGVLPMLTTRSFVSTGGTTIDAALSIERVDVQPVPAPGPPPCVEPFCRP